ncbi:MAG: hypothetical protein VKN33_04940 [Candidatus Sericytochromatia bacterium]|nr:hypothetical protein [Candidatus Sericytochromatia bacterium]
MSRSLMGNHPVRWLAGAGLLAVSVASFACARISALMPGEPGASLIRGYATVTLVPPNGLGVKQSGYSLKSAANFEDQRIAYLRVTAQGADFSKITKTEPWSPSLGAVPLRLQVPLGNNRVFAITALDAAKRPLITMKGMANLSASAHVVKIHGGTIAAADALEQVILRAPGVAPNVDLTALQGLVDGLSGYQADVRAYDEPYIQTQHIASSLIDADGAIPDPSTSPSYKPLFAPLVPASLSLVALDSAGNGIASGVTFTLSDPLSHEAVSAVGASPTVIASAAYGLWALTASHPTFGLVEQEVLLPYASGTLSVQLTPRATAALPTTFQKLLFSQVNQPYPAGLDGPDGVGRFSSRLWQAGLNAPVVVHAGIAYVGEGTRIRKVNLSSGEISTFVGSVEPGTLDGAGTAARFSAISGLAMDGTGNFLYVTEKNWIRRVERSTGQVTTWAGQTAAGNADSANLLNASFNSPAGLTLDASGTVWVADRGNNAIRQIDAASGVTTLLTATQPLAVVAESPYLYIATAENQVLSYSYPSAYPVAGAASGGGYSDDSPLSAQFNWAHEGSVGGDAVSMAYDASASTLYLTDTYNHCIRAIPMSSIYTQTKAGQARKGGLKDGFQAQMFGPAGLAWDGADLIFFDRGNARLRRLRPNGEVQHVAGSGLAGFVPGPARAFSFTALYDMALNPAKQAAYALDPLANRVLEFDLAAGTMQTVAGSGARGSDVAPPADTFWFTAESRVVFDRARDCLYLTAFNPSNNLYALRRVDLTAPYPLSADMMVANLGRPELELGSDGRLYTSDGTIDPSVGASWSVTVYSTGVLPPATDRLVGVLNGDLLVAKGTGDPLVTDHIVVRGVSVDTPFAGTSGSAGLQDGVPGTGRVKNPRRLIPDAGGHYFYLVEDNSTVRRIRVSDGLIETVRTDAVQLFGGGLDDDGSLVFNVDRKGLARLK